MEVESIKPSVTISCCVCGVSFCPSETKTNICVNCITQTADITEGITKQGVINFCRSCKRYQRPPWLYCERESRDLLSLCLRKIKGLNKVKIIEANFIFTDQYSRRIKIKLTIQKEVKNNTSLQQSFVIEFVEHYMQCDDCKKEFTPHTWDSVVQLRQRVPHMKTFLFIEQLILKHNLHLKVLKIQKEDEGIDFYFKNKQTAVKLADFVKNLVPCKIKLSNKLISVEEQNAKANEKHTWFVEIPKVCKEDLVIIPKKLAKELGGVSELLICYKVTNQLHFIDPLSIKRIDISPEKYFQFENDFEIFSLKNYGKEFLVNDCTKITNSNLNESYITSISNKFLDRIYEAQISMTSDWSTYTVKTHLGTLMKPGAYALGYDLRQINTESININTYPDVILIKRIYPERKNKPKIFKLNRLEKDGVMVEENSKKKYKNIQVFNYKVKLFKDAKDMEDFIEDIEQDKQMRKKMNLYRDEENIKKLDNKQKQKKLRRKVKITGISIDEMKKRQEDREQLKIVEKTKKEKEDQESEYETEEEEDDDGVKLEELMNDLRIEEEKAQDYLEDNEDVVGQFIKALDKVKIEK